MVPRRGALTCFTVSPHRAYPSKTQRVFRVRHSVSPAGAASSGTHGLAPQPEVTICDQIHPFLHTMSNPGSAGRGHSRIPSGPGSRRDGSSLRRYHAPVDSLADPPESLDLPRTPNGDPPQGVSDTLALSAAPGPCGSEAADATDGGPSGVPLEDAESSDPCNDESGRPSARLALAAASASSGRLGASVIGDDVALRRRIAQLEEAVMVL